jgi:thiamine-phosphate pyrophosphorylase
MNDHSLYLVISEEYCAGRTALEVAERAIKGGVDYIQMREKDKDVREIKVLGRELASLCRRKRVKFIVNDDPILAKDIGADGVHLGQADAARYTIKGARALLGPDKIIGLSTASVAQVKDAAKHDVDYIAYGPVFYTEVKDKCAGVKDVPLVLKAASKPVVFIGGITQYNIEELLGLGAKNIAVMRAITKAEDIMGAAKALQNIIKKS